ncbi:UDP-N-acetylmuramate:L-alanyl-gamma-D-glutamyl-meso-diaminopimelate ligase [Candidatus Halobeggiatoa sp. HSG11]|nr:UDP-N-acetylmuramate:L-alanyl-gamma-D-glutamyl-meso-diaminopimelate ligase [Candidatus Halobeggiatoa sp. HSG11]
MHIHILGICGTFMAGIAILAKQQGHVVTGTDSAVYPPMSTQLKNLGIDCYNGYSDANLTPDIDYVIIGNALSRGNQEVEAVLNKNLPYISGPQWLAEQILSKYWVLAVAGTHGKTTTSSMLVWILEEAGLNPGFLIGGVPENFGVSARLGTGKFFVVEADEYDSAYFDKRSKFIHYHPKTLVLNNLEYDHADIFPDLEAIQRQFHYLVRTVPSNGLIIHNKQDTAIDNVLEQGCWTPLKSFVGGDWTAKSLSADNSNFEVHNQQQSGKIQWNLIGQHNVDNALAAIASANHIGIDVEQACVALSKFKNVKRRLELRGIVNGISVYDDFAHHPTAIEATLNALRQKVSQQKIIAVVEFRSNTMRMGIHNNQIVTALDIADEIILYKQSFETLPNAKVFNTVELIIEHLVSTTKNGEHIVIMSNGGFENIHDRLLVELRKQLV